MIKLISQGVDIQLSKIEKLTTPPYWSHFYIFFPTKIYNLPGLQNLIVWLLGFFFAALFNRLFICKQIPISTTAVFVRIRLNSVFLLMRCRNRRAVLALFAFVYRHENVFPWPTGCMNHSKCLIWFHLHRVKKLGVEKKKKNQITKLSPQCDSLLTISFYDFCDKQGYSRKTSSVASFSFIHFRWRRVCLFALACSLISTVLFLGLHVADDESRSLSGGIASQLTSCFLMGDAPHHASWMRLFFVTQSTERNCILGTSALFIHHTSCSVGR